MASKAEVATIGCALSQDAQSWFSRAGYAVNMVPKLVDRHAARKGVPTFHNEEGSVGGMEHFVLRLVTERDVRGLQGKGGFAMCTAHLRKRRKPSLPTRSAP